jgi:hypothetical protein
MTDRNTDIEYGFDSYSGHDAEQGNEPQAPIPYSRNVRDDAITCNRDRFL